MDLVERAKNRVVEEIRRQSDGSWPMDGDEDVGLVDAHIDFSALGKVVIAEVLAHGEAYADAHAGKWAGMEPREAVKAMLSHLRKEAGIE